MVGLDSGGGIRTRDLRVMSPTSYLTAPPRGVAGIIEIKPFRPAAGEHESAGPPRSGPNDFGYRARGALIVSDCVVVVVLSPCLITSFAVTWSFLRRLTSLRPLPVIEILTLRFLP